MKKLDRKQDWVIWEGGCLPTLVALTLEEHQKGLMFQQWPPPVMSFPYKSAGVRKFWMKNTPSPLDIIFCRGGKVIEVVAGEPHNTTLVGPEQPVDLVVELPRGLAEQNGIRTGSNLELRYSLGSLARKIALGPQIP